MARILVVDDEPLIALMVADWVKELGHAPVGPVYALRAALDLLDTTDIDGAIIDVSLGTESGIPLAERLVARGLSCVFASGHAEAFIGSRHLAVAILSKPFSFEAFKVAVRALTDRSGASAVTPKVEKSSDRH